MPQLSKHELSGAFGMLQAETCVLLTSHDIIMVIRQLYSTSDIVTRLLGQLNIDAGLINQTDDPTLRQQLTLSVSTIFALAISIQLVTVSTRRIVGLRG